MTKTGTQRSDKYGQKYDAEVVRARYTATAASAIAAQVTMQEQLAIKNLAVRTILDAAGVYPILSMQYQAFSNKLFGICRKFTSLSAIAQAQAEYVKWKTYGSTAAVLQDIWALYSATLGAAPSPL